MVEFGVKIKQIREKKGMTQQMMAEKLYVTRQAVSRWECGARYPDLLTAKKISMILDVSLDELLSGEEFKQNIEKEAVLTKPTENIMQTILYTIATVAYLLLCSFSIYAILFPNEALSHTPAGKRTPIVIYSDICRIISFLAVSMGMVLSIKNRLTPKAIGYIMCTPYLLSSISFLITYMDMQIKKNGYLGLGDWFQDFIIPIIFSICVVLFFQLKKVKIPYGIMLGICILTIGYLVWGYQNRLNYTTDLGFVVTTVSMVGKIGMAILLGYQSYVWNKKRKPFY